MSSHELEHFRQGLENLFRNMQKQHLSHTDKDRLRLAFDHARGKADRAPAMTDELRLFYDRLMAYFNDADRELSPEQVADLEAYVREHLPGN